MADNDRNNKLEVLQQIRDNPFISQQELANRLNISRSAVAAHIATLTKEGEITGRAYVLPERRRILCIGGANVDRKIQSYEPLQFGTSNPSAIMESHGGVARNIAENLARLGISPTLVTIIGEDKEGAMLVDEMLGLGADVSQVIRSASKRTGTYTAILDHDGSMAVACADMAIYDELTVDRLAPKVKMLAQSTLSIVDTNLPAESLEYILTQSAQVNANLIVAPVSSPKARRLPTDLTGIKTLIANLDEIAAISGVPTDTLESLERACVALQARGCEAVVVTMGKQGVAWRDELGQFEQTPAFPVQVVDVTGAGDAFVAGFAYATYHDLPIRQACILASRLASLTLTTNATVSSRIDPGMARDWLLTIQNQE